MIIDNNKILLFSFNSHLISFRDCKQNECHRHIFWEKNMYGSMHRNIGDTDSDRKN